METDGNLSFFVIFYDFVMKCVYKSTIYTFVIRDKRWTPPFVVQKCTCYFCVLGPKNTPPTPYMSGTFVLAPPPPPPPPPPHRTDNYFQLPRKHFKGYFVHVHTPKHVYR